MSDIMEELHVSHPALTPQIHLLKPLTQLIVFGHMSFKEVINDKWGHKGGTWIHCDWCHIRRVRDTRHGYT